MPRGDFATAKSGEVVSVREVRSVKLEKKNLPKPEVNLFSYDMNEMKGRKVCVVDTCYAESHAIGNVLCTCSILGSKVTLLGRDSECPLLFAVKGSKKLLAKGEFE